MPQKSICDECNFSVTDDDDFVIVGDDGETMQAACWDVQVRREKLKEAEKQKAEESEQ